LGIEGTEISSFMSVTPPAGVRQVVRLGLAAMLLSDHVIDLVREEAHLRRKQTVLAAVSGPFDDLTPH
jgi:hypothetical protein